MLRSLDTIEWLPSCIEKAPDFQNDAELFVIDAIARKHRYVIWGIWRLMRLDRVSCEPRIASYWHRLLLQEIMEKITRDNSFAQDFVAFRHDLVDKAKRKLVTIPTFEELFELARSCAGSSCNSNPQHAHNIWIVRSCDGYLWDGTVNMLALSLPCPGLQQGSVEQLFQWLCWGFFKHIAEQLNSITMFRQVFVRWLCFFLFAIIKCFVNWVNFLYKWQLQVG